MREKFVIGKVNILLMLFFVLGGASSVRAAIPEIYINEILVSNASVNLDPDYTQFSDWIELYNAEGSQINLSGYYLTDDLNVPNKWEIPSGTIINPGEHLLFWADDEDNNNHTNFKLKHSGEVVALFDSNEDLVDSISFGSQLPDISYGRQPDGTSNWVYYDSPTPEASNGNDGISGQTSAPLPQFDLPGGFYNGSQTVILSTPSPTAEIYYTLDGSIPTSSATQYSSPIAIGTTTVIRARVIDTNKLRSPVATQTYLIDESVALPVVTVATDPANLWDDEFGIYVAGTNGITGNCSNDPVNWNQDWERPSNVALYELDNSVPFQLDAGIEIFGGCTRIFNRKSLAVRGRDKYGLDRIQSQLFSDKQVSTFRSFVLRNSGNDARLTLFRDAMMQELLKGQMDIDWQGYRPVVVFLNGDYWGIHNIREKIDEDYVESNYDIDSKTVDLLENNPENFENEHYHGLLGYINYNNLSQSQHYEYVRTQMDVDEFMNYQIAEIYFANTDWPGSNIKYWRPQTVDGRWRWMLYDTDFGFGYTAYTHNTFEFATDDNGPSWPNPPWSTYLFRELLKNDDFEHEFMQRFASHINITFDPQRVTDIINQMQAVIAPEMAAHMAKWGYPTSQSAWENNVSVMRTFGNQRPATMRTHIDDYFNNPGTFDLTINLSGPGTVKVSDVTIPASGYSGPYFKNVPLQLVAVPEPGKRFVHWQETGETAAALNLTLNSPTTLTAEFADLEIPLVISELHYNPSSSAQGSDDDYEFLEIFNAGNTVVDMSNFQISDGVVFTFPGGTSIAPGEYIVAAKKGSTYSGQGYQVWQWTSGKLDNDVGERVAISDDSDNVIDEVTYGVVGQWSSEPDGNGPSLTLYNHLLDNGLASSWAASGGMGGTPGQINDATCATAVPPIVTVSSSNDDVILSWADDPLNSNGYEVWRSTSAYFILGDSGSESLPGVNGTAHTDVGAAADGNSYFYIVRGVSQCLLTTNDSNQTGVFEFALVAGSP